MWPVSANSWLAGFKKRLDLSDNSGNNALDHSRVGCRFPSGRSIDAAMVNANVPALKTDCIFRTRTQ